MKALTNKVNEKGVKVYNVREVIEALGLKAGKGYWYLAARGGLSEPNGYVSESDIIKVLYLLPKGKMMNAINFFSSLNWHFSRALVIHCKKMGYEPIQKATESIKSLDLSAPVVTQEPVQDSQGKAEQEPVQKASAGFVRLTTIGGLPCFINIDCIASVMLDVDFAVYLTTGKVIEVLHNEAAEALIEKIS